jgi:DNA-binding NarL/FixJ family response regulator
MSKIKRYSNTIYRNNRLRSLIKAIRQQQVFLDPPLVTFMFGEKPECLTSHELSVLSMLSEGHQPSEIAKLLDINIRLVKYHIRSTCDKLERASQVTMTSSN